jgi:1-acyl-sn-glycerol-3-phosphate acyltransferase
VSFFVSRHRRLGAVGRVAWLLYQPYKWLIFSPILVLSTLVLGEMTVLLSYVLPARFVSWACASLWARVNGIMTPMLVRVQGREHVDPHQSYVIVANHQSFYDVFLLYGWLGVDFKWIIKKEMRRIPFLGTGCARLGHVFIDRSDRKAALEAINAAKPRFVNGTSVLFFPEGTRSRSGELRRFKKGAFRVAADLGLPILPLTIVGTRRVLPPDGFDLLPGRARLVIHPPIPVTAGEDLDLNTLIQQVRGAIGGPLQEGADGSPSVPRP